jgi:hypothetical protein
MVKHTHTSFRKRAPFSHSTMEHKLDKHKYSQPKFQNCTRQKKEKNK